MGTWGHILIFLLTCKPCLKIFSDKDSMLRLPQAHDAESASPVVRCSRHMCPIRVHWHVKQSYTEYWRVKITITNLNFVKNYSQWNLVVLHPNLRNVTQVFSFNYQPLPIYGSLSKLLLYMPSFIENNIIYKPSIELNSRLFRFSSYEDYSDFCS